MRLLGKSSTTEQTSNSLAALSLGDRSIPLLQSLSCHVAVRVCACVCVALSYTSHPPIPLFETVLRNHSFLRGWARTCGPPASSSQCWDSRRAPPRRLHHACLAVAAPVKSQAARVHSISACRGRRAVAPDTRALRAGPHELPLRRENGGQASARRRHCARRDRRRTGSAKQRRGPQPGPTRARRRHLSGREAAREPQLTRIWALKGRGPARPAPGPVLRSAHALQIPAGCAVQRLGC